MTELTSHQLDAVAGGADSFGRCGPGDKFQWLLGNVYTPECMAHDQAVRDATAQGSSYLGAQIKALPKLPAAVGSYFRKRFG
jgi:hypothetical protein